VPTPTPTHSSSHTPAPTLQLPLRLPQLTLNPQRPSSPCCPTLPTHPKHRSCRQDNHSRQEVGACMHQAGACWPLQRTCLPIWHSCYNHPIPPSPMHLSPIRLSNADSHSHSCATPCTAQLSVPAKAQTNLAPSCAPAGNGGSCRAQCSPGCGHPGYGWPQHEGHVDCQALAPAQPPGLRSAG